MAADRHGRKYPGNRRGGRDHVERRSPGQKDLAVVGEVKGDDVKWDGRVAQVGELDVAGYEATQPPIGDEVVAMPGQAHDECAEAQREDLLAAQLVPYARKLLCRLNRLRPGGNKRRIKRAGGGADQQVRDDAALV